MGGGFDDSSRIVPNPRVSACPRGTLIRSIQTRNPLHAWPDLAATWAGARPGTGKSERETCPPFGDPPIHLGPRPEPP